MKKVFFLFCICLSITACSNKKPVEPYPVINVVGSAGKYQRVYCSDLFSSIELIPLESNEKCFIYFTQDILLKDSFIFFRSANNIYSFDITGNFLNQVSKHGQGPEEYLTILNIFFNRENPTIHISDISKILEYDFNGKFISSFRTPEINGMKLYNISHIRDSIFIGDLIYNGKKEYKYCIFDQNGDIVKCFPSRFFFNRDSEWASSYDGALTPIHIDKELYLKDYLNDTIYTLRNSNLEPAYIFEFGEYKYPIEYLEKMNPNSPFPSNSFIIQSIIGTPNFFFYKIRFPNSLSKPKSKQIYDPIIQRNKSADAFVYGIYHINNHENIFLETDQHLQKGIVNDINGGLPFIPIYYAGNNIVIGIWEAEEMKEMLTEEYFAKQTIKDQQAHQKLKELMKKLKADDNPVVVVAKLK